MKKVIHVNQHNIKHNAKNADKKPVLTTKDYKENIKSDSVILEVDGKEVGRFIYSPDKPLPCGAKVWFECDSNNVKIKTK